MIWPTPDNDPNDRNRQRFPHRDRRDLDLAYLIVEELVADPRLTDQPVGVEVQNGVVVLTGTVDTPETRDLIGDTARQTDGVIDICNALHAPVPAETWSPHHRSGRSADQLFQEIVAPLAAAEPGSASGVPATRQFLALLLFLGVVLWGALTILIVWLGWAGVVLAGSMVTVIATSVHRHTRRTRRSR